MTLVVIGASHHCAPMSFLEQLSLSPESATRLGERISRDAAVSGTAILATCNRVEIYASVPQFHVGLESVMGHIAEVTGIDHATLTDYAYVTYGSAAVEHAFSVAAGLDSMAIGEAQILGQFRTMLTTAQSENTLDGELDALLQRTMHVARKVRSQTNVEQAGPSLVEGALKEASSLFDVTEQSALVLGAGGMSGLVVATLRRSGVSDIVIANRSAARAERLAQAYGCSWIDIADTIALGKELSRCSLVFSSTGARGYLLTPEMVAASCGGGIPRFFVDLGLPRDIDPDIEKTAGVVRVDLQSLGVKLADQAEASALVHAQQMITHEVDEFVRDAHTRSLGPTLAALQSRAELVVESELKRLRGKLGGSLTAEQEAEIAHSMRRVSGKLLHEPTKRVKALVADHEEATDYVSAVRNLFDLELSTPTSPAPISKVRVERAG